MNPRHRSTPNRLRQLITAGYAACVVVSLVVDGTVIRLLAGV